MKSRTSFCRLVSAMCRLWAKKRGKSRPWVRHAWSSSSSLRPVESPKKDCQPNASQQVDDGSEKHHRGNEIVQNTLHDVDEVGDHEKRQQNHADQGQECGALEAHGGSIIPTMRQSINRRRFIGSLAAVAVTKLIDPASSAALPPRGELILRN